MESTSAPYPPLSLASRVCSLERQAAPYAAYEQLGAEAKAAIVEMLPDGGSLEGKRVLDFGCGAGRTLRHFLAEGGGDTELWGCDIDAASVEWLNANLSPSVNAFRNEVDPPIAFADGSFDLIWALSVFTHLTENSLPWLSELHRVLTPGGLLIATYMGRYNGEVFTHEPWDEDRIGMNVLRAYQGWEDGGPMVLMSDWWVCQHWGRAFEILAMVPVHGQTWVLLRKRDVQITVAQLAEPADDAREYLALRHNLRQVERDFAEALGELKATYEHSLSWRSTRPLRKVATYLRSQRQLR